MKPAEPRWGRPRRTRSEGRTGKEPGRRADESASTDGRLYSTQPSSSSVGPATSNRVASLGTAKVRPEDQAHAAPMPATPQAQPAGAADLATTAAKQAQLGLVPLPPVRLASLGTAEPKGDPEQAFSKVTAMKETSSDENPSCSSTVAIIQYTERACGFETCRTSDRYTPESASRDGHTEPAILGRA